ncbi:MAG: MBL fold metallo-hydrolase [Bryobacteraceae bacterium]
MPALAQRIEETKVDPGTLAVYWLAQAGFVFKTSGGKVIYIDPYLSDYVERLHGSGFKRMMGAPISAEEVRADVVLCTHEHEDHLDMDSIPVVARNTSAIFAGPIECIKGFEKAGIGAGRSVLLERDKTVEIEGVRVTGVYADHGTYAPDALGLVLDFEGIRVYHSGDTAYRPDEMKSPAILSPDVFIPCINGRYGNMDSRDAAMLARDISARVVIASHFWMFVAHNGDPALFLEACKEIAPSVEPHVMKPGELLVVSAAKAAQRHT